MRMLHCRRYAGVVQYFGYGTQQYACLNYQGSAGMPHSHGKEILDTCLLASRGKGFLDASDPAAFPGEYPSRMRADRGLVASPAQQCVSRWCIHWHG
jgi:hypothetical protein